MPRDRPARPALDHVVVGVPDLDAAGAWLAERHALRSVAGGRHPGWGTANRIVPLGPTYLELVTVVDPVEAARNPFGRWVTAMLRGSAGPGWAVRTDVLDGMAARLRLEVFAGSRQSPAGTLLSWRLAGVEAAAAEPWLQFLIQWGPGTALPGRAADPDGGQDGSDATLDGLRLEADVDRLRAWLGSADLLVAPSPGSRGITQVRLRTRAGTFALDLAALAGLRSDGA